jgi:hypothetical protein
MPLVDSSKFPHITYSYQRPKPKAGYLSALPALALNSMELAPNVAQPLTKIWGADQWLENLHEEVVH